MAGGANAEGGDDLDQHAHRCHARVSVGLA
jgi:hypothetical protein